MSVAVAEAPPHLAPVAEPFPAAVTVTRTSEADFKSRQVIVWLDGERVTDLLWGDSFTRDLAPGPHRLRFSNTLVWKTVHFTLAPGEHAFYEVINRTGRATVAMMLVLGVGPLYLTINRM